MSRGDLKEAERRGLKGLLPIEATNRGRCRRPERNRSIVNGDFLAGRPNRRVKIDHERELYKQRDCFERMFGRLKINRSITIR